MAHAEATVEIIGVPAKVVFDFLADGLNNPKWRPSVADAQLIQGVSKSVGAIYRQGMKQSDGQIVDTDYQLLVLEPISKISFQGVTGPRRPVGYYYITDKGSSTEVKYSLSLKPLTLKERISPFADRALKKEVNELINLKTYLENGLR